MKIYRYECTIGYLSNRYVLIRASRVVITQCTLKWDLLFDLEEETTTTIAWISFPFLPSNFFGKETIFLFGGSGKEAFAETRTPEKTKKNEYKSNVIACPNIAKIVSYKDTMRKSVMCYTQSCIRKKRLIVSREGRKKTKRRIRIKQSKKRQRIKEGKQIINENKFSALEDTKEAEDVQITQKEGNEIWEDLEVMTEEMSFSWVVGGDFSVTLNETENWGGLLVTHHETPNFTQCISSCNMTEIKFTGILYTWWNRRIEGESIFKRLDRVLRNSCKLSHLEEVIVKSFRLLSFWTNKKKFKGLITQHWKVNIDRSMFYIFHQKMKNVKRFH
ncbi:hypothetical protein H5410_003229 [Solanum commersonii]|uniref:DUF4283 domain-containing protein n=1 Tax=Solanum commersonii TaxID=4109 RepID=A0A9J6B4G4_SOLCO|nr:hypothetical protein H5410_003229 [Solanum commersonii]